MLSNDGVGAGSVDNTNLAKQVDRRLDHEQVCLAHGLFGPFSMLEHGDHCRGRRDTFQHERLANERVDECALPGIEFPHDDEQEQFVQLCHGLLEGLLLLGAGVCPCQRRPQAHEQASLFPEKRILFGRKHACQHTRSGCRNQTKRSPELVGRPLLRLYLSRWRIKLITAR